MNYKISYKATLNKSYTLEDKYRDTAWYTQTIRMVLPRDAFTAYNHSVLVFRTEVKKKKWSDLSYEDQQKDMYLKLLKEGDNYVTRTTSNYVASFFHFNEDKRYKNNRNTLIKVKVL